eukprot:9274854-Pyramimonas_sp.AAC.1
MSKKCLGPVQASQLGVRPEAGRRIYDFGSLGGQTLARVWPMTRRRGPRGALRCPTTRCSRGGHATSMFADARARSHMPRTRPGV